MPSYPSIEEKTEEENNNNNNNNNNKNNKNTNTKAIMMMTRDCQTLIYPIVKEVLTTATQLTSSLVSMSAPRSSSRDTVL